ncbi:MAG TPA: hypothetical protein VE777_11700 [Gaiellales bacterium]|jgi:mannose-6-phosphate isomerase-like protein (cupin superfamily)|nr:hypothetical protein [Gaiellales bacterium]
MGTETKAAYTLKNIKEIEDSAVRFGLSPYLEARFARSELELEHSGLSYQRLGPRFRIPFGHRHQHQEELYVVVRGGGRAKLGDEVVDLKAWDVLRVPPETMRGFEAGPDGLEIIAFGAPTRGQKNDADMAQEWWTD